MSKISSNIRFLRQLKGLSQEQMAESLGITRSRLGAYEENRNEPSIDLLITISDFFHIAVDALVRGDLTKTNLDEIFQVFFTVHDPTTLNRQGADVGTQYRSVIFYKNEEQKKAAESIISELNSKNVYSSKVVTTLEAFKAFYAAEDYHQNYYKLNGQESYCKFVIQPKVEKFEKIFKNKVKK